MQRQAGDRIGIKVLTHFGEADIDRGKIRVEKNGGCEANSMTFRTP